MATVSKPSCLPCRARVADHSDSGSESSKKREGLAVVIRQRVSMPASLVQNNDEYDVRSCAKVAATLQG